MRFLKKTPHHVQIGTGVSLDNIVTNYNKFGNMHTTYMNTRTYNLQGSETYAT